MCAFAFEPCVSHTGQHVFNPPRQQHAAGLGQRRGGRQVIASDFNRADHAQLVACAADGALDLIVNQADRRRCFWFEQLECGAVALSWVNRQIDADRAPQRRTVRVPGHHTGVSGQYQLIFRAIYVASLGLFCLNSYAFYSVVVLLKPLVVRLHSDPAPRAAQRLASAWVRTQASPLLLLAV